MIPRKVTFIEYRTLALIVFYIGWGRLYWLLDSTFYQIINPAGAGKWWPEEGEDPLPYAALWKEYQCRS